MTDKQKSKLIQIAQSALRDERHWSVIFCAERADNAIDLAEGVLAFFGVLEDNCQPDCQECKEHQRNLDPTPTPQQPTSEMTFIPRES